jgi:hypothetical protein
MHQVKWMEAVNILLTDSQMIGKKLNPDSRYCLSSFPKLFFLRENKIKNNINPK